MNYYLNIETRRGGGLQPRRVFVFRVFLLRGADTVVIADEQGEIMSVNGTVVIETFRRAVTGTTQDRRNKITLETFPLQFVFDVSVPDSKPM